MFLEWLQHATVISMEYLCIPLDSRIRLWASAESSQDDHPQQPARKTSMNWCEQQGADSVNWHIQNKSSPIDVRNSDIDVVYHIKLWRRLIHTTNQIPALQQSEALCPSPPVLSMPLSWRRSPHGHHRICGGWIWMNMHKYPWTPAILECEQRGIYITHSHIECLWMLVVNCCY